MRAVHVLRKPLAQSTVAEQVLSTGTGSLNIDGTRIGGAFVSAGGNNFDAWRSGEGRVDRPSIHTNGTSKVAHGRWPANLVLSDHPAVVESLPTGKSGLMTGMQVGYGKHGIYGPSGPTPSISYADEGSVSRFFKVVPA